MHFFGRILISVSLACWISTSIPTAKAAEDMTATVANCSKLPKIKKKPRAVRQGAAFMTLANDLESQGRNNLQPNYEEPHFRCMLEIFEIGDNTVKTIYSPWTKGMQTLHYQFLVDSEQKTREILVLYNGMIGLLYGGFNFYVVETRDEKTSYYAMYNNQPRYEDLRKLITSILQNKAEALIRVEWQKGSEELVITEYNSKRLK